MLFRKLELLDCCLVKSSLLLLAKLLCKLVIFKRLWYYAFKLVNLWKVLELFLHAEREVTDLLLDQSIDLFINLLDLKLKLFVLYCLEIWRLIRKLFVQEVLDWFKVVLWLLLALLTRGRFLTLSLLFDAFAEEHLAIGVSLALPIESDRLFKALDFFENALLLAVDLFQVFDGLLHVFDRGIDRLRNGRGSSLQSDFIIRIQS